MGGMEQPLSNRPGVTLVIVFLFSVPYRLKLIGGIRPKTCCVLQAASEGLHLNHLSAQPEKRLKGILSATALPQAPEGSWWAGITFSLCSSVHCMENCTQQNENTAHSSSSALYPFLLTQLSLKEVQDSKNPDSRVCISQIEKNYMMHKGTFTKKWCLSCELISF